MKSLHKATKRKCDECGKEVRSIWKNSKGMFCKNCYKKKYKLANPWSRRRK